MELFLIQHGEARDEAEDPERSLTDEGARNVHRIAAWAAGVGVKVGQIRHSGKRRAGQTAEILGQYLNPAGGVVAVPGLKPNDDVREAADILENEQDPVMLVGHLPFLSRLTGLLVAGDGDAVVVRFKNAGIVCLSRQREKWAVQLVVTPDLTKPG
jgi:phosphohistidine phosphatase